MNSLNSHVSIKTVPIHLKCGEISQILCNTAVKLLKNFRI